MRQAVIDLASQPIRNYAIVPRAQFFTATNLGRFGAQAGRWNAYMTWSAITGAIDGPPGTGITSYCRGLVSGLAGVSRTSLGFHLSENPEIGAPNLSNSVPVTAGETIIVSCLFRCSAAVTANFRIRFLAGAGVWVTGASADRQINQAMVANTWTRLSQTIVVPAGAVAFASVVQASEVVPLNGTLDCTGLALYRGVSFDPGYQDGDYPNWHWTGTTYNSESVGYPYTLESIVGKPLASLITATPLATPIYSSPFTLAADQGRTLYAVYDVSADASAANAPMARIGASTGDLNIGSVMIRLASAGGTSIEGRFQPVTGTTLFANRGNTRTARRHAAVAYVDPVSGRYGFQDSVSLLASGTAFVGELSTASSLTLHAATTQGDAPVAAYAFAGEHDNVTRQRVLSWLARQYGAAVISGY